MTARSPVGASLICIGVTAGPFRNPLHILDKNDSLLYELNVSDIENSLILDIPTRSDEAVGTTTDEKKEETSPASPAETEDLWALHAISPESPSEKHLLSWDGFLDASFKEPVSAYLSEFGNKGFDAALSHQATVSGLENAGRIVRSDVFLESLFRLGLGWNSMFFQFNEQKRVFEKSIRDVRISGVSLTVVDGMIERVLRCGTDMQRIRRFVKANPMVLEQPTALSSVASAVSVLMHSLEKHLSRLLRRDMSLMQVQTMFERCGDLVGTLADITSAIERAPSESKVISVLLEKCDVHEQRVPWVGRVLHEIISRCTRPWLTLVETWIGVRSEKPLMAQLHQSKDSFVHVEQVESASSYQTSSSAPEYVYRPDMMPSSVPADQAQLIFETGRALRLLKQYQPDHPISRDDVVESSQPPRLSCEFSWADIEKVQKKAAEYEQRLRREIVRYHAGDVSRSRPGTRHGEGEKDEAPAVGDLASDVSHTFELFDLDDAEQTTKLLGSNTSMESDPLHAAPAEHDFTDPTAVVAEMPFGPPLSSVLYLSLAPTLSVQAQLVDYSCLHLLFMNHNLRSHISLQYRFQLLGDGIFAARLSQVLFDPEMNSGERRKGVARSTVHTGLRLGSRDTWPPASSELRLVLMGLLTECYAASEGRTVPPVQPETREKELPGGFSFAIRELTGDELTRCKDPNAIEALDFLRLQYKPPAVLESVITSQALHKYDRLFKYLLRLLRMIFVVNHLIYDSTARGSLSGDTRNVFQKFRIDAHRFVTTVHDYVFQVGVAVPWQRLEETLAKVETCLRHGDIDGTIEVAGSLHRLRQYHEETLNQMLQRTFLSKRYEQVNRLLEDIFGTILAFAPLSRLDGASGIRSQNEKTVSHLHATFRKQVGAFVRFLREFDGGRASRFRGGTRSSDAMVFEQLLLRLDFKAYY